MSGGSGSGGRKRSWRYTPPLPTDNDNRSGENVRARSNQLDSSTSFTQFALSGVLEKLVNEIRSLHSLISHNANQEEARYRVLLNENRSLKRALSNINAKIAKLSHLSSANESGTPNDANISQRSNESHNESAVRDDEDRQDSVEAELRDIFARSHRVNIPEDGPSEAPLGDVEGTPRMGYGRAVKNEYFDGALSGKKASRRGTRSASTSSRSRELMETTESMQGRSLTGSGGVRVERRTTRSKARTRSNIRTESTKDPSDEEVCYQDEEDEHQDDDEDEVRPKERVIIKPLPTDLPKPTTFRVSGYRGQSKMTDEWKEYALSIYPIRPHQYWDIRKEDYETLIPDQYLEEFKKDPTEKEKNALIRSIYDWFRYQHRIAQLKVVLSECTTAMDIESLRKVYVEKMKQRGWPIYGKKLKKCEVAVARKQLIESFLDGTMPGF